MNRFQPGDHLTHLRAPSLSGTVLAVHENFVWVKCVNGDIGTYECGAFTVSRRPHSYEGELQKRVVELEELLAEIRAEVPTVQALDEAVAYAVTLEAERRVLRARIAELESELAAPWPAPAEQTACCIHAPECHDRLGRCTIIGCPCRTPME